MEVCSILSASSKKGIANVLAAIITRKNTLFKGPLTPTLRIYFSIPLQLLLLKKHFICPGIPIPV
jgi:hypothetical protein